MQSDGCRWGGSRLEVPQRETDPAANPAGTRGWEKTRAREGGVWAAMT